ncbi:tRNA synthetases class II-domain-containing protein [Daldinia vernicosa]|uniref:tRNA synthetases class II-domain-containing protein n=1 Tax=Daldinia vernicosa TaxID=114800 RepID=UPI002007C89A|nr:tRNA synthetases class II-domain-containing protein [Daldinia vernicosa]KAI0853555.1 tRNA synthetases class II-domain-containing protein [Daldinia vernicosa]
MVRILSSYLRRTTLRCIPSIKGQSLPRQFQPIFQLEHTRTLHDEISKPTGSESTATESTESTESESIVSKPTESEHAESQDGESIPVDPSEKWEAYNKNFINLGNDEKYEKKYKATPVIGYRTGNDVTVHGFISKRRDVSSNLSFCELTNALDHHSRKRIQIVSSWNEDGSQQFLAHQDLMTIPAYSPVVVSGTLQEPPNTTNNTTNKPGSPRKWDLKLRSIHCLNPFPKDIIVSKDAVWPPHQRHLQLRFDPLLHDRLLLRSSLQATISKYLKSKSFIHIETPLLFKPTPEGAREFLVPTRREGYAYALPQSPQQYKQILMASGVTRYYQFAKCFRDEDHRADRQPEFTQLDIEMAFAGGADVVKLVSNLVARVFQSLSEKWTPTEINGIRHPVYVGPDKTLMKKGPNKDENTNKDENKSKGANKYKNKKNKSKGEDQKSPESPEAGDGVTRFPRVEYSDIAFMTYSKAMMHHGTDKPDLRISAPYVTSIRGTKHLDLPQEFIEKITSLEDPYVEMIKVRLGVSPRRAGEFIRKFMDSLPNNNTIKLSPESTPAVLVYDSSKPLNGLSALGHESASKLEEFTASKESLYYECKDGDIIIFHARKNEVFHGSSTDLGRLRKALYDAAVQQGFIPKDNSFKVVWVTEFPLFTPNGDNADPGQGGTAGFSSTHHPFTAPLTAKDFFSAKSNPLEAKADHYDLVINGVEVGGGSRRIHVAKHQEFIMRDVLKMTDEKVAEFSHLLEVLRAGCPPHAGFAFGFDRFLAVLCDVPSIRDVIAFPKTNNGEDLMVGSPAKVTPEQRKMYHLFQETEAEAEVEAEVEAEAEPELAPESEPESKSEPEKDQELNA